MSGGLLGLVFGPGSRKRPVCFLEPQRKSPHQLVRAETTIEEVEETVAILHTNLMHCNKNLCDKVFHLRQIPKPSSGNPHG